MAGSKDFSNMKNVRSEALKKLLVEMSVDCGDPLLLCGFLTKGRAKWFEEKGWLVHL